MWLFNKNPRHLPTATGPFVPGCMDCMVDYSKEGFFVRLYYPTELKGDDPEIPNDWCPWIPDDSYIVGIAKVLMSFIIVIRMAFWWAGNVLIPAVYGAKAKTDQKLKCIILSHGLGGHRFLYTNTCCELASQGFVVAAIEHRDNSASNTFYYANESDAQNNIRTSINYEIIPFGKNHQQKRNEQVRFRADECCKVLDFLINVNNGKVPHNVLEDISTKQKIKFSLKDLVGKLNTEHVTMMGHSFGGATALLALSRREQFAQGVLLDPWMFPIKDENLHSKITKPLLFINTQTFHIKSNVNAMEKFLNNDDRKMFTIKHTTHESQTDSVLLVGYWLNWFMKKMEPEKALKINNSLILTFLAIYNNHLDVERYKQYLEEHCDEIEIGLTKPWV